MLGAVLAIGCGGNLMDEPVTTVDRISMDQPLPPRDVPPRGALLRTDVNAAIDRGLGYFLQRVSVDPDVVDGKFQGFRIVQLRPPDYWRGVDLKPGDIVTQVNGMSIERDIDAYQAFQALRAAPALKVSFLRGGSARELVMSIVDPGAKNMPPQTAPKGVAPVAAPKATPQQQTSPS